MQTLRKYFTGSFIFTFIGLILSYFIGQYYGNSAQAAMSALITVILLSLLEVAISFDNAVVNATVLKEMTPIWQHRFLTWGMVIAVFGMRLVFPLAIVAVATKTGPIDALILAATAPQKYAEIMLNAHVQVASFGGAFLFMVALKYFFDIEKDVHWVAIIEKPLVKIGHIKAVEIALTLIVIYIFSLYQESGKELEFVVSGFWGVITYVLVDGIGEFLKLPDKNNTDIHRASVGMFLYLEVLDASFSFDGVVGAFAMTNNLFLIAIGLGIGAMFVRSLTILLVEKETLSEFRYLEHGAFYAVGALGIIMFMSTVYHIPEVISGLIGAIFIAGSLISSKNHKTEK